MYISDITDNELPKKGKNQSPKNEYYFLAFKRAMSLLWSGRGHSLHFRTFTFGYFGDQGEWFWANNTGHLFYNNVLRTITIFLCIYRRLILFFGRYNFTITWYPNPQYDNRFNLFDQYFAPLSNLIGLA